LDDTRRELAQHYLDQRDVSLADTAYLLGFSEQSSFFRAVRRWFGSSPRHYRARLITPGSGGS
jgi:AraC-like DNA-binding protein